MKEETVITCIEDRSASGVATDALAAGGADAWEAGLPKPTPSPMAGPRTYWNFTSPSPDICHLLMPPGTERSGAEEQARLLGHLHLLALAWAK